MSYLPSIPCFGFTMLSPCPSVNSAVKAFVMTHADFPDRHAMAAFRESPRGSVQPGDPWGRSSTARNWRVTASMSAMPSS